MNVKALFDADKFNNLIHSISDGQSFLVGFRRIKLSHKTNQRGKHYCYKIWFVIQIWKIKSLKLSSDNEEELQRCKRTLCFSIKFLLLEYIRLEKFNRRTNKCQEKHKPQEFGDHLASSPFASLAAPPIPTKIDAQVFCAK